MKRTSVLHQLGLQLPTKGLFRFLQMPVPSLPATRGGSPPASASDRLVVFTDGACRHNGTVRARAGYGVVWPHDRRLDVSKRLPGSEQTNNRAEFMALIEAQQVADWLDPTQQKPLYVYTDSELLINSITKWLPGWKAQNWRKSNKKPVLNRDLLERIDGNPRPLIFRHVRAHTGKRDWESIHNDEADRLARAASMEA